MSVRYGYDMSVLGRVMCDANRECVPGRVHRLDADLEICVCERCGNGWMRDVSAFDKLNEAIERFNQRTNQLASATKKLMTSLERLNDSLKGKGRV
jgi:hypothetical protein